MVHDLRESEARNMVIPELREMMEYYKENEKGIKEMCEIFESIAKRERIETNVNVIRNV